MAHKKAAGTTKNGRDSNPKYLGIKLTPGQKAQSGSILVRQRGSEILPGKNVRMGRDYTLYAITEGKVTIGKTRKVQFNNKTAVKKVFSVI